MELPKLLKTCGHSRSYSVHTLDQTDFGLRKAAHELGESGHRGLKSGNLSIESGNLFIILRKPFMVLLGRSFNSGLNGKDELYGFFDVHVAYYIQKLLWIGDFELFRSS